MDKVKRIDSKMSTDVHIEQVNKKKELTDLEKTAVMQFLIDEQEKELSKTQQLKILNSDKKKKFTSEIELPKTDESNYTCLQKKEISEFEMPKKVNNLSDTIKIKLSDLKAAIQKRELEANMLEQPQKKKSLYDTAIIKLDDIIKNRRSLKKSTSLKVINISAPLFQNKKKKLVNNLIKSKDLKLNVDSEDFVNQLTNLNVIALNRLSSKKKIAVRKLSNYNKNRNFEKKKVHKDDYLAIKDELTKFAVDRLYYQYALKESKKYKIYKASVGLSILVFIVTSLLVFNWIIQGVSINNLSNSLSEVAPIEEIDEGKLVNIELKDDVIVSQDNEETNIDSAKQNDMYWKYLNTPLSSVDFTQLLEQNKDTVGWLIVNNTNINYPVVQTTNNEYYLNHAFDRSKNYAGWVYADYRNSFDILSKNTVIYAHGRKDGVMFGSLNNTLKKNWYTNLDNQIFQFSTLNYNTMWQVFSIYKIEAESYYITTDFNSDESFDKFINTVERRSIYDFGVEVNYNDRIITLSTCFNDKGTRLVVHAKLVKIQER